ncbi:hypothetical protein QQP08_016172 [Theobroma cacao]|nr:hypothetical protein QQP08_016172 [Theobroma cacao]
MPPQHCTHSLTRERKLALSFTFKPLCTKKKISHQKEKNQTYKKRDMILKYIPLDEGMMIMDEAIVKAKKIIEGYPETKFSGEEYQRYCQP